MNILHITHGKVNPFGTSGISRAVYYLNKYQKLGGHNSKILSVVDGIKEHVTFKRDSFVNIEMFPRIFIGNDIIKYIKSHAKDYDVVCFHMPWKIDKILCAKILNKIEIPYLVTSHASYTEGNIKYSRLRKLVAKYIFELNFLNNAKSIHAITREEIMSLRNFGVKVPIFVVPNGIELDTISFENLDCRYFHNNIAIDKKIKFVWIGSFRPYKNVESLIIAASLLPKDLQDDLVFVMIGPTNIDAKNILPGLEKLVRKCKVSAMFHFIGPLYNSEKYSALISSDVYVHPSWSDVISFAVLDAMACGKPCLITRTSNVAYFYKYDFFQMVEPYPEDIARGIIEILHRRKEWQAMGSNARHIIETEFVWGKIIQNITKNYQQFLSIKK